MGEDVHIRDDHASSGQLLHQGVVVQAVSQRERLVEVHSRSAHRSGLRDLERLRTRGGTKKPHAKDSGSFGYPLWNCGVGEKAGALNPTLRGGRGAHDLGFVAYEIVI